MCSVRSNAKMSSSDTSCMLTNKTVSLVCKDVVISQTQTLNFCNIVASLARYLGTAVAHWLRCCATNRKVAGSIPDGVTGVFH